MQRYHDLPALPQNLENTACLTSLSCRIRHFYTPCGFSVGGRATESCTLRDNAPQSKILKLLNSSKRKTKTTSRYRCMMWTQTHWKSNTHYYSNALDYIVGHSMRKISVWLYPETRSIKDHWRHSCQQDAFYLMLQETNANHFKHSCRRDSSHAMIKPFCTPYDLSVGNFCSTTATKSSGTLFQKYASH